MHVVGEGTDSAGVKHKVVVVGRREQGRKQERFYEDVTIPFENKHANGELVYSKRTFYRNLKVAAAICNPEDEFDEEVGIKIAKRRIVNGEEIGALHTSDVTMLTDDAVFYELTCKLNYITEHIDDYIGNKE